ncbi:winged helix-turn-helix domain-containing protein [Halorientalis pallida]|uniref:winged helix-turn-helix domain-containing protein n=1 Tax=Halorientalis pallida TaxID=2479928 RepID=UPI003C6FFFC4
MGPDATPSPPQAVDGRLEALSNHTRRFLLYYLREHGDATQAELTDVVTGWLATNAGTDAAPAAHDERRIALQHVHLPKLLECGLVEHDPDTGVVALGDYPGWVDDCLDVTFQVEAAAPGDRPQSLQDLIDR